MRFQRPTLKPILWVGDPKDTPATMRVTSPFGPRADGFHGALDIGNYVAGDILVSPADGVVLAVGYLREPWSQSTTRFASGNYGGLMAVIKHGEGVVSIFAHMQRCWLGAGQRLSAGEQIGVIGDTGSAVGQPHVHFGMQAPASRVPAGLKTRTTSFGYGLDIDPWPLITGQMELLEEDDMLPDNMTPLATVVVGAGNNLRKSPSTTAPKFYLEAQRTLKLLGSVEGGAWKVGTLEGNTWAIVKGDEVWYVAAPLATNFTPLIKLPTSGHTDEELENARATAFAAGRAEGIDAAADAVASLK